jgi:hypothetical protein
LPDGLRGIFLLAGLDRFFDLPDGQIFEGRAQSLNVIASEATQSIAVQAEEWIASSLRSSQ